MVAGNSFTNVFGGSSVAPSGPSFEAITLSANTVLVWPLETAEGNPYVTSQMNVTATTGGLQLAMPPGNTGSTGVATMMTNVGSTTFTLTDTSGNQIASLAAGLTWLISLTDNTTGNGTWQAIQIGATTSSAQASALAGLGLQALGALLQVSFGKRYTSINGNIVSGDRASTIVWQGSTVGTLQLAASATLTPGWFCSVMNEGTKDILITTSASETVNGASFLAITPGSAATLVCSSGAFDTSAVSSSQELQFNGLSLQTFIANGTYTPNPVMLFCLVLMAGSGGGGGNGNLGLATSGGGGGAGEFALGIFSKATVGASQTITIGAGGAANANGNASIFGSLLSANPGLAGAAFIAAGGHGGTGGSGTGFHITGGDGALNSLLSGAATGNYIGGHGGASFFGGGGQGAISGATDGRGGSAYGSGGGGGGYSAAGPVATAGGAGSGGVVIVIEFA